MYKQEDYREKIIKVTKELEEKLIEREAIIRLVLLAIFSKQHVFLIGEPGVAKTKLLKTVCRIVSNASFWEKLMTKETQEHHLVGIEHSSDPLSRFLSLINPVEMLQYSKQGSSSSIRAIVNFFNVKKLINKNKEDEEITKKESMLYHEFILFDEMFKAPNELLVSTLPMLNERYYTSKGKAHKVPLSSLFAASNELPKGELIEPFVDRIPFFIIVNPIKKAENFIKYITGKFDKNPDTQTKFLMEEIEYCVLQSKNVVLNSEMQEVFVNLERAIRKSGIKVSNRKFGPDYIIQILQVCAWINGRAEVNISDFFLIKDCAWHTFEDKAKLEGVIHDFLFENRESIENLINTIYIKQESCISFFNKNLQMFLSYEEDFIGEQGHQRYINKISELENYYNTIKNLYEEMSQVENVFNYCNDVLKLCNENIFLYGIECKTFSNPIFVEKMHLFLSEKKDELRNIESWYLSNKEMRNYQENKQAMLIGKCQVEYKF
jgi:MoxR-like ATPase